MEDFFKKHNFDSSLKMKQRLYNVIRYYPKIETYEFVNVGIIVYEKNELHYKLLSDDNISKLYCPMLINSSVLKNSIQDLDNFLQAKSSADEIITKINSRYKNVLDTSFQLSYLGNEPIQDVVKNLFNQFIGYKLEHKRVETVSERFSKKTKKIISSEFKNFLEVKKSKITGFSLDFYNKKSDKILHSLIGSINNSQDLFRAYNGVPLHIPPNKKYDFLHAIHDKWKEDNKGKLELHKIRVFNYSNDDEVYQYCENLVS